MSRSRDLAFLRLLFTSGIDLLTLMPVASECIKRLIPSFSLSLIRVDHTCAPHHHYSEYFDEFSHQQFALGGHHFTSQGEDPASFGTLLRNPVPYGNLVAPPPSYVKGTIYEHFFKRNGIHHVLDVALRDASGPLAILGIFREEKAPPFSRGEVALVHELYPLLVHACAAKPMPSRFDEADSAMLVVSKSGVILWSSPQARAWLEDASVGAERAALLERRLLPAACRSLVRALEAHQSSVSRRQHRLREAPTLTMRVPGGRIRLRAYALSPQVDGAEDQIGIQLTLEMDRGLRVLRVLQACDVTPQQRRLAFGLWSGKRPTELCTEMGLTASSLKSYQKDLYARLAVSSAAELVARLDGRAAEVSFDLHRHLPRTTA